MSASSTFTITFKEDVSSIVIMVVPAVFLSPTDTLTAVTTPPIGAESVQSASCFCNCSSWSFKSLVVLVWYFCMSTVFWADATLLSVFFNTDA